MSYQTISLLPSPYLAPPMVQPSIAGPNGVAPPVMMALVPLTGPGQVALPPGAMFTASNATPVMNQPLPLGLPAAQPLPALQNVSRTLLQATETEAPKALSDAAKGALIGAAGAFGVNGLLALDKLHLLRQSMGATSIHALPHFLNIGGMGLFAGIGAFIAATHKKIVDEAKQIEGVIETEVKKDFKLGHGFWGISNPGALETAEKEGVREGVKEGVAEAAKEAAEQAAEAAELPIG